jgi:hypothetical protein
LLAVRGPAPTANAAMLRNPTADHELNEDMVRQSHLDWTIIRPPRLTNGKRANKFRSGEHLESHSFIPQIARADLADFMLAQLGEGTFVHKIPEVMY